MNDPNRLMKWLLVIGLVVLSITILWPPSEKLKGGIDLVGGSSLLFEIDTTGLDAVSQSNLSARVMGILKERVDPKGQLNLEWRPVGNTRLEIRMPRPPKEALERRKRFNEAVEQLHARNISRYEAETALNAAEGARDAALQALVRGIDERKPLLDTVKTTYDDYLGAQKTADPAAIEAASTAYEDAMSKLLETSLPIQRFSDILALENPQKRDEQLQRIRSTYPSFDAGTISTPEGKLLTRAVLAYDRWAENKADLEDPSDLKRRLRGAGVLEFRILAERDPNNPTHTDALQQPIEDYTDQLAAFGPRPRPGDRFVWLPVQDVLRFLHLDDMAKFEAQKGLPGRPIIEEYAGQFYALFHSDSEYSMLQSGTGGKKWKLKAAFPDRDPLTGRNVVTFGLDPRGGRLFGELTGNNVGRFLCIMLDNKAMSYATINERITDRCQISGDFTVEQVGDLVRTLEAGSLPARLKETPLQETTVGPSLGETNRTHGVQAAMWGGIAVVVFMLIYYGIAGGGMANFALMLNLLFVLAAMALMQATFTLPGIAGLILTVGMAVDANVLIFERIREERDRGVVFKKALNIGYDKAFSTIMDANITTLITCVILGFVGSEEVKGFAIVLGIGITTSMFTALFVTRLAFNSLIVKGWLKDLHMWRLIGAPAIDWISLRTSFWPISIVAVVAGVGLFAGMSSGNSEAVYDIEFLGGTSVQVDLEPGVERTDEQMAEAIGGTGIEGRPSAVQWLSDAADQLEAAEVVLGEAASQFVMSAPELSADELAVLMQETLGNGLEQTGVAGSGQRATFDTVPGAYDLEKFKGAVTTAAQRTRQAADRLRNARIQSVSAMDADESAGLSFEIVTVETNRPLVQAALLATMGKDLTIQRRLAFTVGTDEELTREQFFVVENDDTYVSDVLATDANFEIRRFRGGAAIAVELDEAEEPLVVEDFTRRLREVALQTEFEQYRTRQTAVLPLDPAVRREGAGEGHRKFAVLAVDDTYRYDDDPVQWTEGLAKPTLAQVEAALGSEKSLSKVVQFAPQIAVQAKNRAVFALILAFAAIVAYLWLRFGTKEYGLAAIVALVHDVSITLGLVVLSHFLYATIIGKALMLSDFKIDLPMVAAVMTVIGYSLNDTIVVFDRIRENRGKLGTLSPNLINNSINQTLSRTMLTSLTTFMVVFILYIFGGKGIHSFSFALLIGVVVGTYSSIAIAAPLLYQPQLLRNIIAVIVSLGLIGVVLVEVENRTARLVLCVLIALGGIFILLRGRKPKSANIVGRPAPA